MSVGNPLLAFGAILKKTLEDDTIKEYQCKDCGYIWRYGDPAEDTPIISDDQEHTQERVLLVLFGFTDLGEIDDFFCIFNCFNRASFTFSWLHGRE